MNAPTVLLYNLETEKGRKIKLLCLTLKLRARSVAPEEYGLSLSGLLKGEKPPEGSAGGGFQDEMLVMANLSGAQADRFLQGFRRKKIPPVGLKAVLTPTNAEWDSARLHDELRLEHEAMLRGESAHEGRC